MEVVEQEQHGSFGESTDIPGERVVCPPSRDLAAVALGRQRIDDRGDLRNEADERAGPVARDGPDDLRAGGRGVIAESFDEWLKEEGLLGLVAPGAQHTPAGASYHVG